MPQMFYYSSKGLLFPRSWNCIEGLLYSGGLAVLGNFECRLEVTMVFMWQFMVKKSLAVFIPKDALSVWTNLGKHFVVRLVMRLRKITTLSSGFRILRVWWRFVHAAVLSFIGERLSTWSAFFFTQPRRWRPLTEGTIQFQEMLVSWA